MKSARSAHIPTGSLGFFVLAWSVAVFWPFATGQETAAALAVVPAFIMGALLVVSIVLFVVCRVCLGVVTSVERVGDALQRRRLRKAVLAVPVDWRPGYGEWHGFVPAVVALDSAGELVTVLRKFWHLASKDEATARINADRVRPQVAGASQA